MTIAGAAPETVVVSQALADRVTALMRSAAELAIMPRYRRLTSGEVAEKSVGEVVTVADFEAEALLGEGLAALLPDALVVGEEAMSRHASVGAGLAAPLCWVIDPLDGTANFASGQGPFGVMVALAAHGLPVAGWILDPLSGRICHGRVGLGGGAWIDGRPWRSGLRLADPVPFALSTLYADDVARDAIAARLGQGYLRLPMPRCAADQYPRIVTGDLGLALFGRTLAWDHAAGVAFVNAAGGCARRPDGSAYRVDDSVSGLLVASDPALWDVFAAAAL